MAKPDGTLEARIANLRAGREAASAALARLMAGPLGGITPDRIAQSSATMRERVTSGEEPFLKAWIGSIVDRIEVDDSEIRILGRKDVLEQRVLGGAKPTGVVRNSVRGWLGD